MLKVEIAQTPDELQKGLMFRKSLNDNCGMLFEFKYSQKLNFWGLNTYIPLDIAFVSEDKTIIKIDRIKPLSKSTVGSEKYCLFAIEANEDYFVSNDIKEGDSISIKELDSIKNEKQMAVIKFYKNRG